MEIVHQAITSSQHHQLHLQVCPEAHEDHASPPEEESVLQDNGKSPEVHDEAQPKGNPINSVKPSKGKSSVLNKEACSSDDDNDSSFDDSLMYKYGFTDSTLLEDYEDGVFGTLSNNPSASLSGHVNPKGKKNKKKPPGNKMVPPFRGMGQCNFTWYLLSTWDLVKHDPEVAAKKVRGAPSEGCSFEMHNDDENFVDPTRDFVDRMLAKVWEDGSAV
nr:hypothetical protein Iba_chr02aCG23400 [Ipomoea batatas]